MDHGIVVGLFAMGLFLGMLLPLEVGRRIGARRLAEDPKPASAPWMALSLSCSVCLSRLLFPERRRDYTRRQLIVEETNDIGTAYLRLDLLPEPDGTARKIPPVP